MPTAGCVVTHIVVPIVTMALLILFLCLLSPMPRTAFVDAYGGECTYTGNGTATCTETHTGIAKNVTVRNPATDALAAHVIYVGVACTPHLTANTSYTTMAMPNFDTHFGVAECVPHGTGDIEPWVFIWPGKITGAPDGIPHTFTPVPCATGNAVGIVFVLTGVAAFITVGGIFLQRFGTPTTHSLDAAR